MEIWKDIEDYEGYQISNYGRVKSLYNGRHKTYRELLLTPIEDSHGHLEIQIFKYGIKKMIEIHRLVAQAFLPNPEDKPIVHHIDHNKQNNMVDNLMWVTEKEHKALHPEIAKICSKPINQYDFDGNFIKTWPSSMEIKRELGFDQANIIRCCKGGFFSKSRKKWVNVTQAYGYIWKYAEDC